MLVSDENFLLAQCKSSLIKLGRNVVAPNIPDTLASLDTLE